MSEIKHGYTCPGCGKIYTISDADKWDDEVHSEWSCHLGCKEEYPIDQWKYHERIVDKNEMESLPRFWMVWCQSGHEPMKQHDCSEKASIEAQRLAAKHPGKKFFILKSLSAYACDVSEPRFISVME